MIVNLSELHISNISLSNLSDVLLDVELPPMQNGIMPLAQTYSKRAGRCKNPSCHLLIGRQRAEIVSIGKTLDSIPASVIRGA